MPEQRENIGPIRQGVRWLRDLFLPSSGLMIGENRFFMQADASGNIDPYVGRPDGSEANLTGEYLVARCTNDLTLTTSWQSLTGDGNGSKARLLLPTIGEWTVRAICDFEVTTAGPSNCAGGLFVNDSGSEETGYAHFRAPTATGRGSVTQEWKVITTSANTPVELKTKKAAGAGVATTEAGGTALTAAIGAGGGSAVETTDHGTLTGRGDDDHTQYGQLADAETVPGLWDFTGGIKTDVIAESTGAAGVTGDGVKLKDGSVVIANAGYVGSVGDTDAMQIEADGDVVFSQDVAVVGTLGVVGVISTADTVRTDTITEYSGANGVRVEGVQFEDGIISFEGGTTVNIIGFPDNLADALSFKEGGTAYLTFVTTDAGEKVAFGKTIDVTGNIVVSGTVDGVDVAAHDVATTGVHGAGANTLLHSASTVSALTTVGTIGTGTWQGSVIDHERGGIEADISAITTGGLLVGTGAGAIGILGVGADGLVLTAQADGTVAWEAGGGGAGLDLLVQGDLHTAGAAGADQALAIGAAHSVLWSDGTDPSWTTAPELQYIKDTGGTTRYTTATSGTWLNRFTGATRFDNNIGHFVNPSALFGYAFSATSATLWYGMQFTLIISGAQNNIRGINAAVAHSGTSATASVYGGWYQATKRNDINSTGNLVAIHAETRADNAQAGIWAESRVIEVGTPNYAGANFCTTTQIGILIQDQFSAAVGGGPTTVYGLKVADITGGTNKHPIYQAGTSDDANHFNALESSTQLFSTTGSFGSGIGVLGVRDAGTNPSANPANGGILYSDSGAGKWRGSGGTTTTFGAAEPHCRNCGRDFVVEWESPRYGHLIVCMWCASEGMLAGVVTREEKPC